MVKKKIILILLIVSLAFQFYVYATDIEPDNNISTGGTETPSVDNTTGGNNTVGEHEKPLEGNNTAGEHEKPLEGNNIGGNIIDEPSIDNNIGGNTGKEEKPSTNNTLGGNTIEAPDDKPEDNNKQENKIEKPNNSTYEHPSYREKESENANLKSLSLEGIDIAPEFKYYTTEYTAIVGLDIENITVFAEAEDSKATVTVTGHRELQEGENTVEITVEAEAGNTKTYTIIVTKTSNEQAMNAKLKSLIVRGFNMYPSFQGNIYNYNLNINEQITKLEILAETENSNATFVIEGNEKLQEGDNLIKIIVTAENGETTGEYKLNVYINSNVVEAQKENKLPALILLAILIVIAIVVAGMLIKKK